MDLVFVKAGGSWITFKDKPFSIDYRALEKLSEILSVSREYVRILLGHGGGSFAHPVVKACNVYGDRVTLILCHKATKSLNHLIVSRLIDYGLETISFQTSSIFFRDRSGVKVFIEPVKLALDKGFIPVLYGDCILDHRGYYHVLSTEDIFGIMAPLLRPKRIVYLERVGGIYTKDPLKHRDAELIPLINRENYREILEMLEGSHGIDVTGGMRTKIENTVRLAREYGIESIIVSGSDLKEAVKAITRGRVDKGTLITW